MECGAASCMFASTAPLHRTPNSETAMPAPRTSHKRPRRSQQCRVRPLVVDGFEFDAPLDAALHLLWLLQRLSFYEKHREGQPCDGFRFRQGIIASRKLLRKLKYKPGPLQRPNNKHEERRHEP